MLETYGKVDFNYSHSVICNAANVCIDALLSHQSSPTDAVPS
jgi:hypothetical protein